MPQRLLGKQHVIDDEEDSDESQVLLKGKTNVQKRIKSVLFNEKMERHNETFKHFNNNYEVLITNEPMMRTHFIKQLEKFLKSPFEEDQKFAILYINQLVKDNYEENQDIVELLFYDRIFNLILKNNI